MTTGEENLTSWRKNLDSRYISGEDLLSGLHGLKPEMIVTLEKFEDMETFDQQKNSKVIKTGFWLKEQNGTAVYKPVLLNKINARFFEKELGTDKMEKWLGHTAVLYAQKDSRHGHVARFKRYSQPQLVKDSEQFNKALEAMQGGKVTIEQIKKKYQLSKEVEQLLLTPAKNG